MPDSKKAVSLVVALLVLSLLGAFLFPVVIGNISEETQTVTQNTTETVVLQENLNLTLDDTNAGTNATYTVNASGSTATTTVAVGSNSTVTVDGADVTIALTEANADNATADVTYPTSYGWGGGASALWTILPVMLVLGLFLYLTAMAIRQF